MNESLSIPQPSLSRRRFLNFLTGSAVAITAGATLYPISRVFVPPNSIKGDGRVLAKDALGTPIPTSQLLAEPPGTRALVAGLDNEPTYLTLTTTGQIEDRGIVDNCTHLGCTFPWNGAADQFQCPCHGSRFAADGAVMRGPADRPLKLVHVLVEGEQIWILPWTELDPRTDDRPWWVKADAFHDHPTPKNLMQYTLQISEQLSVAMIQPTPDQIQDAAQLGFKSVLNLRSPQEDGFLINESQLVQSAGMNYANLTIDPANLSETTAEQVLTIMDQLSNPILLHCKGGLRSGAMALLYEAVRQQWTTDQLLTQVHKLDLPLAEHPQLLHFIQDYVDAQPVVTVA